MKKLEQPTEVGFYWVNRENAYGWEVVQVHKEYGTHGRLMYVCAGWDIDDEEPVTNIKEWYGPLQPPKF